MADSENKIVSSLSIQDIMNQYQCYSNKNHPAMGRLSWGKIPQIRGGFGFEPTSCSFATQSSNHCAIRTPTINRSIYPWRHHAAEFHTTVSG